MKFNSLYSKKVPQGSVLGINYSGMHDTSVALVAPDGEPLFCVSLERLSRIKQDGRLPRAILEDFPWEQISCAALSVNKIACLRDEMVSKLHPVPFGQPLNYDFAHGPEFFKITELIPCETIYVPHHKSHASSAFWASGFDDAVCLVYDGGMSNENCFGGFYRATTTEGIAELDQFYSLHYANITKIYTAVTALLGFSPLKHEGKITGLAAYGKANEACRHLLLEWLNNPAKLENLLRWKNIYSENEPPELVVNENRSEELRLETSSFSGETLAATVQELAESHVLDILHKASEIGWTNLNICLAGGLFANVKINQRVAEAGFQQLFVVPPMSDDGTALGAAWCVLSERSGLQKPVVRSMYLGPRNNPKKAGNLLKTRGVHYHTTPTPADDLARLLADGYIVAIYQGASEFGPRALGNRSILAPATKTEINEILNRQLNRTEFMPFAPVVRMEDADLCFENISTVRRTCEFMTVTVNCTKSMMVDAPAVVHVDGTARPQLVTRDTNELLYDLLTAYSLLTGYVALVNTSFNVHEEPIVCTEEDALRGFFESGLDYMYMEGAGIIKRSDNLDVEIVYLREKINDQNTRYKTLVKEARNKAFQPQSSYPLFACSDSFACYLVEGFHKPEARGVWSSGRYARMMVSIDLADASEIEAHITLDVKVFDGIVTHSPVLQVMVNGRDAGYVLFRETAQNGQKISFYCRINQPISEIEFKLTDSGSPFFTNHSTDQRELGFWLSSFGMVFSPVREADSGVNDTTNELAFWGI